MVTHERFAVVSLKLTVLIGQVKVGESPYGDWSPLLVGWEHDDVSLAE